MNDKPLRVTSAADVTVEGTLIYGSVTVDGTMTIAGSGNVYPRFSLYSNTHRPVVSGAVVVNGSLSLQGYLENYALTGEDKIVFGAESFLDNSRFPADMDIITKIMDSIIMLIRIWVT